MAYGPELALRLLFPKLNGFEKIGNKARHTFEPSPKPITIERELRKTCSTWQENWDDCISDDQDNRDNVVAISTEKKPEKLGEIIMRYQALRADELAYATQERNRHYLNKWLSVLGENLPLTELTEEQLVKGRGLLAKTIKPSTLNCTLAILKSVLRWAENRSISVHPAYRSIRGVREIANARATRHSAYRHRHATYCTWVPSRTSI
jgi:hypothetical protein